MTALYFTYDITFVHNKIATNEQIIIIIICTFLYRRKVVTSEAVENWEPKLGTKLGLRQDSLETSRVGVIVVLLYEEYFNSAVVDVKMKMHNFLWSTNS